MRYRNTGITPIRLPSGRAVKPGGTFSDRGVPASLIGFWVAAQNISPAPKKRDEESPPQPDEESE